MLWLPVADRQKQGVADTFTTLVGFFLETSNCPLNEAERWIRWVFSLLQQSSPYVLMIVTCYKLHEMTAIQWQRASHQWKCVLPSWSLTFFQLFKFSAVDEVIASYNPCRKQLLKISKGRQKHLPEGEAEWCYIIYTSSFKCHGSSFSETLH